MSEINEINSNKKDATTKVLIVLVTLMTVAVGVLGFLLYSVSQQKQQIIVKTEEIIIEKDNLKSQLTSLLDDYDELETSNDSLNSEIVKEKQHIEALIKNSTGLRIIIIAFSRNTKRN